MTRPLARWTPPPGAIHIGPEEEPAHTLGWDILAWTWRYLRQPDGEKAGEPWMFTREQAMVLLNWYAVNSAGKFVYRVGKLRRLKGWGKDPFGAALCCVELIGPCRFGGWRKDGRPIAVPHSAPWVQTVAVSQEQTRNTTTLLPAMISKEAIAEYRIELGKTIVYALDGRARLEAITSSPAAMSGGRPTFVLKNETQFWTEPRQGHAMSEMIRLNVGKSRDGSSRVLAIANAHEPGLDSDAERDYNAHIKIESGKSRATGFLYDSLEAPADVELVPVATGKDGRLTDEDKARAAESLRRGLLAARGDSTWVNIDRLMEEIYDPRTSASAARQWYLNQIQASIDSWVSPQEWDACRRPLQIVNEDGDEVEIPLEPLKAGQIIVLGLDGGKTNDHTVLVACRVEDGCIFKLKAWQPEDMAGGITPLEDVSAEVARAFGLYDVVGFYADRTELTAYNAQWERDYGDKLCARASALRPVEWDMSNSKASALAAQAYHDAIVEGMVTHDGDGELAQYHYNARRKPTIFEGAVTFQKESPFSSRKVDGVAAAMLAWRARQDYLALPETRRRKVQQEAGIFFA